jgi:DHA2 family metal-tetracycline-proton antiporter-like MFS transporter
MTAATASREHTVSAPWLALLAGPLSFGIAAPALILSRVAGDLGVSVAAATWIVTGFGLGIAVGTPLLAGLIGHRGVRAALLTSAGLLLLGVVLAVAVPSLPVLAAAGVIQGLGSAGLTAIAMNLAKSPRVMGLVTAALAVFGATAPLVGSLLTDALSWQATLALPGVALLGVPACLRFAPTVPTAHGGFDGRGAVLLTAVVTALVFVPQWPVVAGACVVAFAVLLGFHLRMRPDGFVPTILLRTPRFLISSGLAFALAVVNFGMFYGVPIQLARHAGWTASQIGIAMLWPLLVGGTVSWVVVTATARLRMGVVLTGFIAAGVTAALLGLTSVNPVVLLVAPGLSALTAASGQGVFAVRATAAVPDERRPAAIGLFTLCYLLGAAFGPAIVALLAG